MSKFALLIRNARQVVHVAKSSAILFKSGTQCMNDLETAEDSEGLDIVVDSNGFIVDVCQDKLVESRHCNGSSIEATFSTIIDAKNSSIIPGFVDCHTHACYAGDRLNEFVMKLQGATYMDIHKMGGGIHYTVRCTRSASEEDLLIDLKKRLLAMLRSGTTAVEVKTGYGLDTETELKMLRVINKARRELKGFIDIIATFCGAHAVPQGDNAETSTQRVIEEMLPAIHEARAKEDLIIQGGIDIFCEKGIFENDNTRRILEAGKKYGLVGNFHGDELSCQNSVELAVEAKSRAVSHIEEISDNGIDCLAKSASSSQPTIGVLLPTTAYLLKLNMPPGRKIIEAGGCVALGSDFNPNAYCFNMSFVMNLACVLMRLSPQEALTACTLNSAAALGISDLHGAISIGRLADLIIIDSPRWENLIYQVGCSHELISYVIKGGRVVFTKPTI